MADEVEELCERLQACFKERNQNSLNWKDIRDIFQCLKIKLKDPNNRTKITPINIEETKTVLLSCEQQLTVKILDIDETLACCLMAATEAFRFLRNAAAGLPCNQDNIMLSGIIDQVKGITRTLLKPQYQESDRSDITNDAIKSGIQLLGNIVVTNESTQEYVWRQCFPEFFLLVMTSANLEIQNCICMVIYNCISSQRRYDLVSSFEAFKIMSQILHLCADHEELEWGYFIVDTLVVNGHLSDLYIGLEYDPTSRIILLDFIEVHLTGSKTQEPLPTDLKDTKDCSSFPEESLTFLADKFEGMSTDILKEKVIDFQSTDNMFNGVLLSRLLRVLSTATAHQMSVLQNHPHLLDTALDLLHVTNSPDHHDKFSNANHVQDCGVLSPSHGFKRDLVRLIGNMCYQHKANQDQMRKKEGIPLILDHCNIDEHNPYICQWAVFALRNVLQNNYENQQIVASLDQKGLVDNSRLHQFGIECKDTDDGQVKLVRKDGKH